MSSNALPFVTSVRDVILVAHFELMRAVRTWQALALIALYLVASVGAALLFIGLLSILEAQIADGLAVQRTRFPGAMTERLIESGELFRMLSSMVGDEDAVRAILKWPVLALFHTFMGLRMVPFLAAMTASEALAGDVASRAVRFELVRTGRLELVMGRFVGQAVLAGMAIACSVFAVWITGLLLMVGQSPLELLGALCLFSVSVWVFSLPFVGVGVGCSQLTSSPAWSRVLAIALCACGWVGYTVLWSVSDQVVQWIPAPILDLVLMLFPFEWRDDLWTSGLAWWASAGIMVGMGLVAVGLGAVRFARRDV